MECLYLIGSLLSTKTTAIKQEGNGVHVHRLPVTVSIHQLLQLSASLDPEEHLISILTLDLEIDVNSSVTTGLLVFFLCSRHRCFLLPVLIVNVRNG